MMFPKKFRKKRGALSNWRRKCLAMWSKIIRGRAHGQCEHCPRPAQDAHHIIPRGTSPTMGWFNLDNGIALCYQCHRVHGPHSLDIDEQIAFRDWVRDWLARKGIDYEILRIKCKAKGKISEFDYWALFSLLEKDGRRLIM